MTLLPQRFYRRHVLDVARDLLGKRLQKDGIALCITEVEAYAGAADSASHCRFGRTARNAPMWGPPGRAYVYLCYGLHNMLNLVTGPTHDGSAILVRACEPIAGLDLVRERRRAMKGPALLTGPGKIGAALDVDPSWSGHAVYRRGGLELHDAPTPKTILTGPRVGIDFAQPSHRDAPWRFAVGDTRWVSQPRASLCEATSGPGGSALRSSR